ncbi:hypothetical protein EJ05DRAFT_506031 [Pseudovirgaria hyperparasitica]|uniref:Uncharacterized protein n=1 Tax=Pseudovirgaria hyperparasitica TaxID=470096 RepID=A0A6A6VRP5_9PEZI|nr:uncharacterized protein EJ05DRAFT_506031 [Pseudovirgaria hyperparasitica]KAF2752456.1 hypothetical protein EJ05DRAFT_506031 [Pseudovirgaria hyperparasitica]
MSGSQHYPQEQSSSAQSAPHFPQNFGVPGLPTHFWNPTTTAFKEIGKLYSRGAKYDQEDVVWHAWDAILRLYFPEVDDANGVSWSIRREAYRGLPPVQSPSQTKPDVIAVRLMSLPRQPGQIPQGTGRDFLWVECKAANHDTPHGWKDLTSEAVIRLGHAHPDRPLSLILAIGWKCMLFTWDPTDILQQAHVPNYILSRDRSQHWPVDVRIKSAHAFPWANPISGAITPDNAFELDSWTLAPPTAGLNVLYNGGNLGIIEHFLVTVRLMPYHLHGVNPASF